MKILTQQPGLVLSALYVGAALTDHTVAHVPHTVLAVLAGAAAVAFLYQAYKALPTTKVAG